MYGCLPQTSLETLEDRRHLLQLPVRQHVRVVCHVVAHPHLYQQTPIIPHAVPAPETKQAITG